MPSAGAPASRRRWSRLAGGIAEAFADANFRRYSVGSVVSWLGFFVQAVAVAWVTWSLTHSTAWLASIALLDAVPMSLLAPIGGVVADRHDRFRVLLACYAVATLQSAALALLAVSGRLTIEWIAVLTLAHGIIHAFSVPSQFGLLPRFVARDRLPSAIAVASTYTQLGLFVGPALAGWIILHFGPATAFASNVVGYGVYFVSAGMLRTPAGYRPTPRARNAFVGDLLEGVRGIASHRGITALLVLMIFGDALSAAVRQMLPAFADRGLHGGVATLSTLLACGGVGATASALWLAQGGARRANSRVISGAFLGFLAATALLMSVDTLSLAGIAMALRGFCFEICRTATAALLQTSVADEQRGRLMSTQFLLQQGASAIGVALIGASAEVAGLRVPVFAGVALGLLAWGIALAGRKSIAAAFEAPDPIRR